MLQGSFWLITKAFTNDQVFVNFLMTNRGKSKQITTPFFNIFLTDFFNISFVFLLYFFEVAWCSVIFIIVTRNGKMKTRAVLTETFCYLGTSRAAQNTRDNLNKTWFFLKKISYLKEIFMLF